MQKEILIGGLGIIKNRRMDNISFEKSFIASKGKPIIFNGKEIFLIDRIQIEKKQQVKVEFIATNSEWRQGFVLKTKGVFRIEGFHDIPKPLVFWEDESLRADESKITVISDSKELIVYNVWDVGNGTMHYWHNGAAMEVVVEGNVRNYYCNDGYPDADFDDLVFRLELLKS